MIRILLLQVNRHVRWMCTESFAPKAAEIAFSLGQLIKHRKYGWTGVVVGYDATCYAGEDWKAAAKVSELTAGQEQPFYHILPNCLRRLEAAEIGGTTSKLSSTVYVAQENVDLIDVSCDHTNSVNVALSMLLNPALPRYFSSLHVDSLTFVPDDSMESLYNEDFLVSVWKSADSRGAGTIKLPTPKPVSGPAVHSLR
jgi:hemimethylated DNA binding protein